MITPQQSEFIAQHVGDETLTPTQAAQLLMLGQGDTVAASTESGKPDAAPQAGATATPDGAAKPGESTQQTTTTPAAQAPGQEDPNTTVIQAKDGKHTIPYDRLVEARDKASAYKSEAEAAQAQLAEANRQLAELQAQAEARAAAGVAPTKVDNQVAAAQAAIDQGVDPAIFGDFSEAALAKGIQTLVSHSVKAQIEASLAQIDQAVDSKLKQALEPVQKTQAIDATKAHYTAIYEAHPDADSLAESKELADWIGAQPSFVRDGYAQVLQSGNAAQVIELFDSFKKAAGTQTQAAETTPNPEDVKAKARQAIESAKPAVPTSLSDIPGSATGPADQAEAISQLSGPQMLAAMQSWTPERVAAHLNRRI